MILLPLLTLGVLGPFISARTIEAEATGHTAQLIRQVTRNIEFYVRQTESIISIVRETPIWWMSIVSPRVVPIRPRRV